MRIITSQDEIGQVTAVVSETLQRRAALLADWFSIRPFIELAADETDVPGCHERIQKELAALRERLDELRKVTLILASRSTDSTHLSVAEAAKWLGYTTKTIRNRISRGELTLEVVAGSRRSGIPIGQLTAWIDARVARAARRRQKQEL